MIPENKKVAFYVISQCKKRHIVAGGYIQKGKENYSIKVQEKWYDIILDIVPEIEEEGA